MSASFRFVDQEGRASTPGWVYVAEPHVLDFVEERAKTLINDHPGEPLEAMARKALASVDILRQLPTAPLDKIAYDYSIYRTKRPDDAKTGYVLVGSRGFSVTADIQDHGSCPWTAEAVVAQMEGIKAIGQAIKVINDLVSGDVVLMKTFKDNYWSVREGAAEHVKRLWSKVRKGTVSMKTVEAKDDFAEASCVALFCAYEQRGGRVEGYLDNKMSLGPLGRAMVFESELSATRFCNSMKVKRRFSTFQLVNIDMSFRELGPQVQGLGSQTTNFSEGRFADALAYIQRKQIEQALKHASYDDLKKRLDELESQKTVSSTSNEGTTLEQPVRARRM